jgi:iron complex transport system ATP-binding protein
MLQAKQLGYSINGKRLLRSASLSLLPGELLVVLGPNGAGKSTLLKTLGSELVPGSGSISLDGRPLENWSRSELAQRRAVMPQSSHIVFPFTVFDVVMMGRSPHLRGRESISDERIVMNAMALTGVVDLAERNYNTLSGGEQQRVQLARALSQVWVEPNESAEQGRYLLLDEPVASMDPAHQLETLRLAKAFSRRGVGVFLILHDINLAAMFADRIAVMAGGELRLCGSPGDVLTPDTIHAVFGIKVSLQQHPELDCPLIVSLPQINGTDDSSEEARRVA